MASAEEKYKDIIHMERPWDEDTLRRHPKMDLSQRAKIFSPFAAVRGHGDKIREENEKANRVQKKELSEEDAERLDEAFSHIRKGVNADVGYFLPDIAGSGCGEYVQVSGKVEAVDTISGILKIKTGEGDALAKPTYTAIPIRSISGLRIY